MMILEPQDFERITDEVVNDYFNGTPLNDGIYKRACDLGLNPEQIRQIVWQANTKTHLDLFEKKAEDKMVEFPVADADYILRRMYAPPQLQPLPVQEAEKVAMDFLSPIAVPMEKVAEDLYEEKIISPETQANRKGQYLISMRKTASEIQSRRDMAYEEVLPALKSLNMNMRKYTFDVNEFEKDAFALYGEEALMVLNWLRPMRHAGPAEAEKLASDFERVVDTDTFEMQKLAFVIGKIKEIKKYNDAFEWLHKELGDVL